MVSGILLANWALWAFSAGDMLLKRFRENPAQLTEQADVIGSSARTIEARLDEQVLREFRSGIQLLCEAVNIQDPGLRSRQLDKAGDRFANLRALDPAAVTAGTSGRYSNIYLKCAGFWGSYWYYLLNDDPIMAMTQYFKCGLTSPLDCVAIFGEELLDPDLAERYHGLQKVRRLLPVDAMRQSVPVDSMAAWEALKAKQWEAYRKKASEYQHSPVARAAGVAGGLLAAGLLGTVLPGVGMVAGVAIVRETTLKRRPAPAPPYTWAEMVDIELTVSLYESMQRNFVEQMRSAYSERPELLKSLTVPQLRQLQLSAH